MPQNSNPAPHETKEHARHIDEPLGTREDFSKMSGRQWSQNIKPK